jgi:hypothetical protein
VTFSGEKRDLFLRTFLATLCHFPDSALSTEEWLLSLVTLQPQNQGLQGDGTPHRKSYASAAATSQRRPV